MVNSFLLGTFKEAAVLSWLEYLTTARENSDGKGVRILLGHQPYVCFSCPPFIEARPLVELIDDDNLLSIDLHAVSSKAVEDEHLAVRVGFSSLLEVSADFIDHFLVFDVSESNKSAFLSSNVITPRCFN